MPEREWSDAEREAWWESEAPEAATHVVIFEPVFRVRVAIPPWSDEDEVHALLASAWDMNLPAAGEPWTEHADDLIPGSWEDVSVVDIESLGSASSLGRVCRSCGCTDDRACEGGCSWAEDDLCSECA